MVIDIGDIFWMNVVYPNTGESETRPVVVVGLEGEIAVIATFATITTSEIEDFNGTYDKWKSPIFKWREAGLREPSYVKANCVASIDRDSLLELDYIGKMSSSDFKNTENKINEFFKSGENPW